MTTTTTRTERLKRLERKAYAQMARNVNLDGRGMGKAEAAKYDHFKGRLDAIRRAAAASAR